MFSGLVFLLRCRYRAASRASVPASHFLKSLYTAFRLVNELLWDLLGFYEIEMGFYDIEVRFYEMVPSEE